MNHAQQWYFSKCSLAFLSSSHGKASFVPGDTNWPYWYDSGNQRQAAFSNFDLPAQSLGFATL